MSDKNAPINLPAPPQRADLHNLLPFNGFDERSLTEISKMTGGIPDFAKKALSDLGGVDKDLLDRADNAGRK